MPVIHANPGPFRWTNEDGTAFSFRPTGKLLFVNPGMRPNAFSRPTGKKKPLAARFFVGFNVGAKQRWDVDDLVTIVTAVRKKQTRDPDASFIAQKGIYTSRATGKTVVEKGAQIVLLNFADSQALFTEHMIELGETLARKLKQELVILEIQRSGVTIDTIFASP